MWKIVFWQKMDIQDGVKVFVVVVQLLGHIWLFGTPWTTARQVPLSSAISPCPPLSPRVRSNSWTLSWWCYLTISSSATPLLLPSVFPSIRIFFQWVSSSHWVTKSIGASVSASVLPVNIQNWFPLVLTGLISLKIFAYMKEKNM